MENLFNDLIPSGAGSSSGLFDDLIPQQQDSGYLAESAKGIAGGAVGTAGTMLKGAAGQIKQGQYNVAGFGAGQLSVMDRIDRGEAVPDAEDAVGYQYMTPEQRRDARAQLEQAQADFDPGKVEDMGLYKVGQATQDFAKDKFAAAKGWEDSWTRAISEGLGSTVPFLAAGAAGPGAGLIAGSGMGVAASTGEAIDRAVQAGATQEQIMEAVKLGGLPGLTEQLPIETLFGRVPLPVIGRFATAVQKVLAQALAEGGQEALQQTAQNLISRYIYNPDQEITEGVLEAATIGAIVGGGLKGGQQAIEGVAGIRGSQPRIAQTGRQAAGQGEDDPFGDLIPEGAAPAETILGPDPVQPEAQPVQPIAPEAIPGDTERASSPRLTPEDRASPLPNDLIDDGKALIEQATGQAPAAPAPTPATEPAILPPQQAAQVPLTPAPVSDATRPVSGRPEPTVGQTDAVSPATDVRGARPSGVGSPNAPMSQPAPANVTTPTATPQEASIPAAQSVTTPATDVTTRQPIPRRDMDADTAVTAKGRSVPVQYAVVEAASLVPSQTDAGTVNPAFPAELQPRDRTRGVSATQVQEIAGNINPRLLDKSPRASDGAPIIAADGVVESGNGRVLALRKAYAEGKADGYRDYLASQGYPVDGMTQPVLVRVRQGEMSPQDRQAFTREANERDNLAMSATERAMADSQAMSSDLVSLYRGGDVDAAGNRDFVRSFISSVVSANDRAGMIGADGALSQEAVRRVQGALLAKAYGDADLVASLVESTDSNIKAIGGALMDVAPQWAQMRAEATEGRISPEADQTPALLEAVRLVDRARREDRKVAEFVGQTDIFSGSTISPHAEAFLRFMFRNNVSWTMPAGRDRIADALRFYVTEMRKTTAGTDLLGEAPAKPSDVLKVAKDRQYGSEPEQAGLALAQPSRDDRDGEGVRPSGGKRAVEAEPVGDAQGGAESPRGGDQPASKGGRRKVGVNVRGNPVFEDENGVRSYSESGILVSESVEVVPGKGMVVNQARRGSDFITVEEAAERRAEQDKATTGAAIAQAASAKPAGYGSDNKVFTKDAADRARALLRDKFRNQTSAGLDPEMVQAGITLAGYHIEAGARSFAAFSRAMIEDLGESARPYLRSWYEGVRYYPEFDAAGMTPAADIDTASTESAAPNAPEPASSPAPANVLTDLRDRLISPDGGFATIVQARKFLADNGWKPRSEATANKEAEELIEHAVVLAARDIIRGGQARGPAVIYDRLVGLYQRQPRLASRTSQSMAEQAYSTPVPLAYVASRLGDVTGGEVVYEPTAGNGALLIEADPAEQKVFANEINETRADALRSQGFSVTGEDAMAIEGPKADRLIANPPFGAVRSGGASTVFTVGDYSTTAIDQAIVMQTLDRLDPEGRAVFIVGSVKDGDQKARSDSYNTSQKRKFYKRLYDNWNVVEHFTVSGDLYQKQGAGWPVDVIVVDGKGKSSLSLPAVRVPMVVSTWADLKGYLDGAGNRDAGRTEGRPGAVPVAGGEQVPAVAGAGTGPGGTDTRRDPANGGGRPGVQPGTDREPGNRGPDAVRAEPAPVGSVDGGPRDGALAARDDAGRDRDRVPAQSRQPRVRAAANATGQVPYRPYSRKGTPLDTLVPFGLGASMDASLERIEKQHGDIDAYVADALGYKAEDLPRVFSAEQIDAIALAINNVANGDAFIIGDQTGIGKGRVVAAAIRYAHKQGMTPVFVTEKPDLYGDMFRDLTDIEWTKALGREPNIFMTNAGAQVPLDDEAIEWITERDEARAAGQVAPPRRGRWMPTQTSKDAESRMGDILAGRFKPDVVFTTYDQMNSVKGEETSRRRFMDQVSSRAFIIMDESHNAGGQGADAMARAKKGAPPPRSEKFREWVSKARSVMYSSATYAKNPNVMDLYSRTDMAKAVDDPKDLPALIEKGKVPLQQVVASMLADAGQYARRERSFEGVEYGLEVAKVDQENYAQFASAIRSIFEFDRALSDWRGQWIEEWLKENGAGMAMDGGIGEMAANSTEFASIMHNIVNQMLLSIKADAAAQKAVDALNAGEKPVIALSFTSESFIKDYADDKGIQIGQPMDIDFRDVVRRYLERTLRITVKLSDDTKQHIQIPVSDLDPDLRGQYEDALRAVERADLSAMPVSPIDWIRHRITQAGYTVREVTGRSTMIDYGAGKNFVARPSDEQGAAGKRVTIKKFNDGSVDAVILNRSGSTGVSLHASSKFKDRRRRRMILAQADANIDTHMQMLGRVHRTGQVIPPAYTQLAADIPAEARPTAVLMRKMASLNANTTASRKSAFTADSVDFMNEYGDMAAIQWAKENPFVNARLGSPVKFDDKGKTSTDNPIQKLTGRIMLLSPDEQQDMLDTLTESYNAIVAQKEAMGENALEAKVLDLQAEPVSAMEMKPATGSSPFQAAASLETMMVKSPGRAMKPKDVVSAVAKALGQPNPTEATFARAIGDLAQSGKTWADRKMQAMWPEFKTYREWVVKGLKNPSAQQNQTTKAQEQYQHWQDVIGMAHPGALVNLSTTGEDARTIPAIVLEVTSTGKAQSPVAGSAWNVTFAIPDMSRQLTVPFSQIGVRASDEGASLKISPPAWTDKLSNVEQMFEKASKEGKEERVIATGNILAAFDQLQGKGQIIQFTDVNGDAKPGVLMPRGYSQETFAKERRVRFQTAAQAMRFLSQSDGKMVATEDDVIEIRNTFRGYVFTMPAARAKGGRYFTDDAVRAVYDKWVKRGSDMTATVDETTASRLIDAMSKIGARFAAPSEPDLAYEIVHGQAPGQASQGGRRFSLRDDGAYRVRQSTGGIQVEFALSESFVDKAKAVTASLRKELDGLGLKDVSVRVSESIAALIDGQRFAVDGQYFRNAIDIALDAKDTASTLHHEAVHAMRKMGLFSETEWAILSRKSKAEWMGRFNIPEAYAAFPEWAQVEEGIAHAYQAWRDGQKFDGILARSFKRMQAFIEALGNALRGNGFTSSAGVFAKVASGEVGSRPRDRFGRFAPNDAMFQSVWHGTPHDFDRFTLEKIGTGEGAQAYGWGLYFAGRKEVATWYRDKLSKNKRADATYKGYTFADVNNEINTAADGEGPSVLGSTDTLWDILEALALVEDAGTVERGIEFAEKRGRTSVVNWLDKNKGDIVTKKRGSLFQVSIPEDSELLLWDKPLSEQPEGVREKVRSAYDGVIDSGMTGSQIYRALSTRLARLEKERAASWVSIATASDGSDFRGDRAASEALRAAGIPGHKYLDGASRADGDGSYNYVIYDDARIVIEERFALRREPETAAERQQITQGFLARGQLLDRALRVPFDVFGGVDQYGQWKPGKYLSKKAGEVITTAKFSPEGKFAFMNGALETARAGLVDRYGLDPAYVDRERARGMDERRVMVQGVEFLKSLQDRNVGPQEARVLQAILTGEEVADADMARLALPIRQAIDELGQEAVSLGLISAESYERNRGSYLHRVYARYEADQNGLSRMVGKMMGASRKKIIGDEMKGRGIFFEVDIGRLTAADPEFKEARRGKPVKGEKFKLLERMQADMMSGKPKATDRVYWPADRRVPADYAAYEDRGTWELRGEKGGKAVLWRDYTKVERESMGEILDARYTIGKTYMLLAHDLATGRFYKDISENEDWSRSTEPSGLWKDAADVSRYVRDPELQWVRVPDSVIAKTGGKKRWGALAGKWVRAEIWRDLNEIEIMSQPTTWRMLLTQWKLNKTARSPVVHMNNIMSNLVFMDLADVRAQDLIDGIRSYMTGDDNYQEAAANGAFGSDMMSQEVRDNVLKPVLEEILKEQQDGTVNPFMARAKLIGRMADKLWTLAKTADQKMIDAYRAEDEIFRMATFMRRKSFGDSSKQAADFAREQFLDYDIRAPWVNAARNSVLPFISYTYRAVPLIAQAIATRPWKLAKYFMLAYMANALAYAWDDEGDEERERASLRDEEQGNTWIGVPRMVRMPFRNSDGLPVFLDIRRWIPAGDVFDTNQGSSAIPIPAPLQFGGPLMLAAEVFLNKQGFTGEEITTETDTWPEKGGKVGDYLWKAWMPSAAWVPGSWYWQKIGNAVSGATDAGGRPYDIPSALASSVGVKLKPQDVDQGLHWQGYGLMKIEQQLKAEGRRLARQRERGLISQRAFDDGMASILEKMERLQEKADRLQEASQ